MVDEGGLHDGLGLFHLKLPQRFAQCQCRECAQVLQLDVELRIVFHFAPGAAAYTQFVKNELDLWTRVIKTAGIKPE